MSRRDFGKESEDIAIQYLQSLGFSIVERNYYAKRFGEIDIIAIKDNTLHFIEVKSSKGSFEPIYNITNLKLSRIIKSAQFYMTDKKLDLDFCIDALVIYKDNIELFENITI